MQAAVTWLKQAISGGSQYRTVSESSPQVPLHSHVCSETDLSHVFTISTCHASPDSQLTEAGHPQKGGKQHRWGAPYREQIRILFTRTIKTRRFEALSTRDFLQFLIVGVLAGKTAVPLALPWHALHGALSCPLSHTAMPIDVCCHALFHALLCPLLYIASPFVLEPCVFPLWSGAYSLAAVQHHGIIVHNNIGHSSAHQSARH